MEIDHDLDLVANRLAQLLHHATDVILLAQTEVGEVAEMVAWLGSDLCTFATGATFDLSGGRSTY